MEDMEIMKELDMQYVKIAIYKFSYVLYNSKLKLSNNRRDYNEKI